nr:hypothetical protein BaRGS_024709 [Batillaria attramentaria]
MEPWKLLVLLEGVYLPCLLNLYGHHQVACVLVVPGLPRRKFVQLGDINIGAMLPMSRYDRNRMCSDVLGSYGSSQNDVTDEVEPYDVVGVIGASLSSQTVSVAHLLGPAHIPLVSFFSTSDDFSNKYLFPYFLRTVPPDRFQFRAIFSIIQQYGWSYISVVYTEGSYGENGFKQLRDLFDQHHVCLAAVLKVPTSMADDELETVVESLVAHKNARVVVIISSGTNARNVIQASGKVTSPGTFIWIGSDGWAYDLYRMGHLGQLVWDAFVVSPISAAVPEYDEYFEQLTPDNTSNPWFEEFWDRHFECSLENGTCSSNLTVGNLGGRYPRNPFIGHLLDTVYMFTNATVRVLNSPECRGRVGAAARACVTGPRLLQELKVTRQAGHTGWLELDENGDRLGKYKVQQVVPSPEGGAGFDVVTVAEFDSLTGNMTIVRNVTWAHHMPRLDMTHPESRCSWPCGPGEARVPQEVTCCWLCQPCRVNEYLAYNGTRCESCPSFTWPDPDTANTTCKVIPPYTPQWNSLRGGLQASLALLSLFICVAVVVFFHRHRHCRVIKASSRELSYLMLLAISLGYATALLLIARPGEVTCRVNFLLFCLSFALIYGPLFVRALRIYRIFEAGQRSARRPRMIDASYQLLFSGCLLSVQMVMCIVVMAVFPEWHKLTMKVALEPYVELSCDLPVAGLASFLAYNLLLVAVCAFLAFKTRRLPDNFNESRFISMCVTTTLVMWLAFIPGYLLAWREHLKMLMLALALALNHSTALVFLFLPKVYAVMYLEGAADTNTTTTRVGLTMETTAGSSRVVGRSQCSDASVRGSATDVGPKNGKDRNRLSVKWNSETNGSPNFIQVLPSSDA